MRRSWGTRTSERSETSETVKLPESKSARPCQDARHDPIQTRARSHEPRSTHRPKYLALRSVKAFHFSGRSSRAKIAETGHTGTQAPQSMHSTGSMYSNSSVA